MSRHKLVKSLNLEDEIDDFDGGANYDEVDGEQISPDHREQLRIGTAQVRSLVGTEVEIADAEIQESLWYYYFDVEKTVKYILNRKTAQSKKSRNIKKDEETKALNVNFFKDSPWLDIPEDRKGEILIEPLYPPGKLLGGAPAQETKVSKLAALTAARKNKGYNKNFDEPSRSVNTSVALLNRLSGNLNTARTNEDIKIQGHKLPVSAATTSSEDTTLSEQNQLTKERKQQYAGPIEETNLTLETINGGLKKPLDAPIASPSTFARAMFGSGDSQRLPCIPSQLLYFCAPRAPDTDFDAFIGPSPEDIVLEAQKPKEQKNNKRTQKAQKATKPTDNAAKAVDNLTIEDTPRARSKNLDVLVEFEKSKPKNAANFVVIGHVDAGKSTLMGRLLYDLKVVDQRTVDRYKKEAESIGKSSFALAWVLDQGTEERNRGVTIDIAMNKFETERTSFTILDAPGHRDFIPNMIAGASQADFAVLVIDASIGSFESGLKGQTKEHALLVRSMGVTRIVVAVNKLDTVRWSQDRFTEISTQVSAFLCAAGFLSKNVEFVPCSGLTGENIVQSSQNQLSSWYAGSPLISLLESSEPITRAIEKPLRLTINDIFRGGVTYPLSISGRLDSGSVQTGDLVLCMPSDEKALVKAVEVDMEPCDWAVAGQNAVLHLADIEAAHLKPGDVVCSPSAPLKNIMSFRMKILAFEHILPMHVDVHRGRLHAPGRITQLISLLDKSTGAGIKGKKLKLVKPGTVARVVVEMEAAVPLEGMTRVVLRASGETVGAGLVEVEGC